MANRIAVFNTTKGVIKCELFEDNAPITATNFIELVERGFYNGLTFHRYEPNFVIQGGCPLGNGTGGSKRNIPLEVSAGLKHDGPGVMAMARSADPNSASSQFYFTLKEASFLDMKYAVFGKVIEGMEVVAQLRKDDVMEKVSIEEAPKN